MIINKRCISAFANTRPFVALTTKSQLFDTSFSLSSELMLVNYKSKKIFKMNITEKFVALKFCETAKEQILVAAQESGEIYFYRVNLDLVDSMESQVNEELLSGTSEEVNTKVFELMDTVKLNIDGGEVTDMAYLPNRETLCVGSSNGILNFLELQDLTKKALIRLKIDNLTSILWNPAALKIIVLGSSDGAIRILDLQKKGIISTLRTSEVSNVKKMMWAPGSLAYLLVQSESNFIYYFDLSRGKEGKLYHSQFTKILDFDLSTMISSDHIELICSPINKNGNLGQPSKVFPLKLSGEIISCNLSETSPMAVLERDDGSTEIRHIKRIPTVRRMPHIRIEDTLISPSVSNKYKVIPFVFKSESADEQPSLSQKDDGFYEELISKFNSSPKEEIIDLLYNSSVPNSSPAIDNSITVNFSDIKSKDTGLSNNSSMLINSILYNKEIKDEDLFKYSENVKASISTVRLLSSIISSDASIIDEYNDFCTVFFLCKIFNNYSSLSRISNSRILGGLCLQYSLDYSLLSLSKSKDGKIIHGIFTNDNSKIIDNRIMLTDNIYRNFIQIKKILLENIKTNEEINSELVNEYFWFKTCEGNFDEVKNLRIANKNIQKYIKSKLDPVSRYSPSSTQYNLSRSLETTTLHSTSNNLLSRGGSSSADLGMANKMNNFNRPPISTNYRPLTPNVNSFPNNMNMPKSPSVGSRPSLTTPMPNNRMSALSTPGNVSGSIPNVSSTQQVPHSISRLSSTPQSNPRYNTPSMTPGSILNKLQSSPAQSSRMASSIPNPRMASSINNTRATPNMPNPRMTPNMPNSRMTPNMPNPRMTPNMPNPRMTPNMPNPRMTPNMPSSRMTPNMPSSRMMPNMPNGRSGVSSSALNNRLGNSSMQPVQSAHANSDASVDAQKVINEFDNLVLKVKNAASTKNSILLKAKKNEALNLLSCYESMDKRTLTPDIISIMDIIVKRFQSIDKNLLTDLAPLVKQPNTPWIKGLLELIRIGFF